MKFAYRTDYNAKAISAIYGKSLSKPEWYEIKNLDADCPEIVITDYIGWPYNDPADLIRTLTDIGDRDILVRISSPGGDVFDGVQIFNALQSHKGKVTVRIEALAASIASLIALAGGERQAYKNAMIMIHEPYCCICGNQYELSETIELLSKISNNMIVDYVDNTNVGKREIKDMLKAETWMTAKEAKEKGFIDTILEAGKATKAKFDTSIFSNLPDGMSGDREGRELTEREAERALRDAGASRAYAKSVIAGRSQGGGTKEDGKNEAGKEDVAVCTYALNQIIRNIEGKK